MMQFQRHMKIAGFLLSLPERRAHIQRIWRCNPAVPVDNIVDDSCLSHLGAGWACMHLTSLLVSSSCSIRCLFLHERGGWVGVPAARGLVHKLRDMPHRVCQKRHSGALPGSRIGDGEVIGSGSSCHHGPYQMLSRLLAKSGMVSACSLHEYGAGGS